MNVTVTSNAARGGAELLRSADGGEWWLNWSRHANGSSQSSSPSTVIPNRHGITWAHS